MSAKSMAKGKAGEREARDEINRLFPWAEAKRCSQFCGGGPDDPDVKSKLPVHIEVKRRELCRPYQFIDQAVSEAAPGKPPIVLFRSNKREWLVIMRLDDLPDAVNKIYLSAAESN